MAIRALRVPDAGQCGKWYHRHGDDLVVVGEAFEIADLFYCAIASAMKSLWQHTREFLT